MRPLTYFIATSADGFIAAEDGSFDAFLQEGEHVADLLADYPETLPTHLREPLGVTAPNRAFDAVLMGRATYDVGHRHGITSPYGHLEQYVFARSFDASPDPRVTVVSEDAGGFVRALKQQPGLGLWLCGGGQLAADLFEELDELVLKVNPVVLGAGIPLFAKSVAPAQLTLTSRKSYSNGVQRLHYAIHHRAQS